MNELKLKIAEILGRSALDNNMQIPHDTKILARAINYLATQLIVVCDSTGEENEKYLSDVLKNATEILS